MARTKTSTLITKSAARKTKPNLGGIKYKVKIRLNARLRIVKVISWWEREELKWRKRNKI